ncbi:MAG: BamA/TamA family outer membrane protein, partial [Thermoguttaceae bacterium]|nr:BamA/TamA family outer membrane protein [Thermoguttaceae bacterium]
GYAGYRAYDDGSASAAPSQYADSPNYANYEASISTDDEDSAPGFSDGVYGSVGQEILDPIAADDEIYDGDVLVKVQEGRTGMFQASIGVNSDYGLVGNVSFTERNFNLFRLPTSFWRLDGWKDAFRGGGQIFSAQASPGDEVQRYSVSWDVPYVFNTKYTFGVTGLYGDHSFDDWFESRYGGELRLGRQWTPRFSTTANFGAYNVKIKDPSVDYVPDLTSALGKHDMYTLGLTATYDTRNHPFTPSAGYVVIGTIEQVLGSYQFPRASLDARYYKTLRKRFDGSGRWIFGLYSHAGWTGDDTPIYERYYGGGSQTIRGFEYREVTPRYANTHFGVGGNFEFYNTAELLIPVSGGDEFHLAFFVDAGTVAESIDDWGTFRVAPGFGLRFAIPMLGPAPLALDFTFPVLKDDSDVTQVFSFGVGLAR